MPLRTDNQLFLGHHKSMEHPDGELIMERKHPKGSYVGVFESYERGSYGEFFVVTRENRRLSLVDVAQPKEHRYTDGGKHKMIDEDFMAYRYSWGFGEDKDEAIRYFNHILASPEHPAAPKPWKSGRVRDAQREKVYAWENEFYTKEKLAFNRKEKIDEVTPFLREIEADFDGLSWRSIELTFREKGGCYQRGFTEINLASYGWRKDIVIHEMAHWVASNFYKREARIAGHGPEFVGVFMLMLEKYLGQCLPDMINAALAQKIKFVFPAGGLDGMMEYVRQAKAEKEAKAA